MRSYDQILLRSLTPLGDDDPEIGLNTRFEPTLGKCGLVVPSPEEWLSVIPHLQNIQKNISRPSSLCARDSSVPLFLTLATISSSTGCRIRSIPDLTKDLALRLETCVLHGKPLSHWMTNAPRCQASRAPEKSHPAITSRQPFISTSPPAGDSKCWIRIPILLKGNVFAYANNYAIHNTPRLQTVDFISPLLLISVPLLPRLPPQSRVCQST
jgi:hypothetical protein